jgi:hypothetical protein
MTAVAEPRAFPRSVGAKPPLGGGLLAATLSNTPGGNPSIGDDCANAGEHTPKAIEAGAIKKRRSLRIATLVEFETRYATSTSNGLSGFTIRPPSSPNLNRTLEPFSGSPCWIPESVSTASLLLRAGRWSGAAFVINGSKSPNDGHSGIKRGICCRRGDVHVSCIVSPGFRTMVNGDSAADDWLMIVLPFLAIAEIPVPPTRLTCTAL